MRNSLGTLVALALLAGGCSAIKVSTDYDPDTNFASLRSFAWLPTPREKTGNPRLDNPLLAARIERSIESSLAAKGFTKKDAGTADFFVTFHVGVDRKVDVATIPTTYRYGGRWGGAYGTQTHVDEYEEGTLLIDLIDRKRDTLVWRGSGQGRLHERSSPEERVQQTVDAILEKFPPTP